MLRGPRENTDMLLPYPHFSVFSLYYCKVSGHNKSIEVLSWPDIPELKRLISSYVSCASIIILMETYINISSQSQRMTTVPLTC